MQPPPFASRICRILFCVVAPTGLFGHTTPKLTQPQFCTAYALTGPDLPAPIKAAIRQHAADKQKLLQGHSVMTLASVYWVIEEKQFAACVFRERLKALTSDSDAERWWNHIGTGTVLRGRDGRFSALYINANAISGDMAPYFQSPRLHPEVVYELSALMEYADTVISTQNPSSDPQHGVA